MLQTISKADDLKYREQHRQRQKEREGENIATQARYLTYVVKNSF